MQKNYTVDSAETLERKIAEVREAQAKFATYYAGAGRQDLLGRRARRQPAAHPAGARWRSRRPVWASSRTRSSRTTTRRNISTTPIRTPRPAASSKRTRRSASRRLPSRIGVIAAVIPTTNPTSTAIFKTLISLKTRNGIIISPHPRAKASTIAAAKVVLDAAVAAGAPKNIIGWIDVPSLELTNLIMKEADIILATGGPGMVKAAYSSGKPALGVGAGNTPAIIDDIGRHPAGRQLDHPFQDLRQRHDLRLRAVGHRAARRFTTRSKTSSPRRGCYFLNKDETEKVRKTIIINGALNAKIVGQKAAHHRLARRRAGARDDQNPHRRGRDRSTSRRNSRTRSSRPFSRCTRPKTFKEALDKAERLIADGGFGHTASLYVNPVTEQAKIDEFGARMKTCRILVNTPSSHGGIGDLYNFKLTPSLTLGCGSWGGNSVSENVGIKHLVNIKTVAERRENMLWFRAPVEGLYQKGLPARRAGRAEERHGQEEGLHRHRQLPLQQRLHEAASPTSWMKWASATPPSPTSRPTRPSPARRKAPKQMAAFEPDCIIALGGGSAMDAGQDHVGDVRASRGGLPGYGDALRRHPQENLHLPEDGRKGLLHRHPDVRRYRQRGHALRRHHRRNDRRQVSAGRLRAAAEHGHRRRRPNDDDAQGPDERVGYRRC